MMAVTVCLISKTDWEIETDNKKSMCRSYYTVLKGGNVIGMNGLRILLIQKLYMKEC